MRFAEWLSISETSGGPLGFDFLWRIETVGSEHPFYATDLRTAYSYGEGDGDRGLVIVGARFGNVLRVRDKSEAGSALGLPPLDAGGAVPGAHGPGERKVLDYDAQIARAALGRGYDAVHYEGPGEVQVLRMGRNEPQEWEYNDEDMPVVVATGQVL